MPAPACAQPELITDDPRCNGQAREPDPWAKPTWEQWKGWDVYRRLLNDHRLRGHDQAFKLWHWLHNCKGPDGRTYGFRAQAWYIARKHGWKPATVYASAKLLSFCGYLTWNVAAHCHHVYQAITGRDAGNQGSQGVFPFLTPVTASCASKGIPNPASSAPKGTAGMPHGASSSAPTGIPYTLCEISGVKEGVTPAPEQAGSRPKLSTAERISVEKQLEGLKKALQEVWGIEDAFGPKYSPKEKAERKRLREEIKRLEALLQL
jgi:hypothetical protein